SFSDKFFHLSSGRLKLAKADVERRRRNIINFAGVIIKRLFGKIIGYSMSLKIFFAILALSAQAASALTIKEQRGSVEIDVSKQWEYEQNILGLPHIFLTKDTPERSSLS